MQTNPLELIAAGLGVVSVSFVIRRRLLAFPLGIAMSVIFGFLFWQKQFYAQMALQVFFIAMQVWGWTQWHKSKRGEDASIAVHDSISGRHWLYSALALAAGIAAISLLLRQTTDGRLVYLDATTTTLAIVAQFWMNRQQLRHWFFWMIADALLVVQMAHGGLYWTMLLNAVLFVQAVVGFFVWKSQRKKAS
jgi:nicotinamide mononucleotide transporter